MNDRNLRTQPHSLLAVAALMSLVACGGGGDVEDGALVAKASIASEGEKRGAPPPPPPPPPPAPPPSPSPPVDSTVVGALALASSNAAGQAASGFACGLSADGNLVAFESGSGNLVAGDTNNVNDVFVKNLRTGAVQRASAAGGASCRQMTPDGRFVLMSTKDAVVLRDLVSGTLTQVSPAANSIPNNQGFSAGSVSDDGNKVAIVSIPTTTYVGAYNFVNTVPARIMVRNLADGSLVTLPTDNGNVAQGEVILGHLNARLSPDGRRVAFVSSSSTLLGGDTNGQADVFVRDLASGATRLASSSSSGGPATRLRLPHLRTRPRHRKRTDRQQFVQRHGGQRHQQPLPRWHLARWCAGGVQLERDQPLQSGTAVGQLSGVREDDRHALTGGS